MNNNNKQVATFETNLAIELASEKLLGLPSKREYTEYYKLVESILDNFYALYDSKCKGLETVADNTNSAYKSLTLLLQAIGKVKGSYITTTNKAGESQTTLFEDCMAYCHTNKPIILSDKLQELIQARAELNEKANKALATDAIKEYKQARTDLVELSKLIRAEKKAVGSGYYQLTKASKSAFAKAFTIRISQILNNRQSLSIEQIEEERKVKAEERKARRKQAKAEKQTNITAD